MSTSKLQAGITLLAATVITLLLAASNAAAGGAKLEGAWIAKAPEAGGQWTYVLAPDPSGHSATGHGFIEVGFNVEPLFGPYDEATPLLIQLRMTGRDTAIANSIWYGRKKLPSTSMVSHELVFIGTARSAIEFLAPDKLVAVHDFAFYAPSKDADGDGLPDAGATPDLELQLTSYDTRLPSPY